MWKLYQEELRKIASRKIIWIALFVLLAFVRWRLETVQNDYFVTINGENIYGKAAIEKDKELTARHAGILTEETVRDIYDRYGFSYENPETGERKGNFCSQFITERMTNIRETGYENPEEIQFYQGEEWERNAAPLLNGEVRFDYVYGWSDLEEMYGIVVTWGLLIVLIIGLSPVFSEEYTIRTADILLTTRRGKKSVIWIKIAAAMSFAVLTFAAVTGYVWAIYLKVFGAQGLEASPCLLGVSVIGYSPDTVKGFYLYVFFLGLAGSVLLAGMVLAASALCKNSFITVIVSLAVFLLPVVWMQVLAPMYVFGIKMTKAVSHVMVSLPAYLVANWGYAFTGKQIVLHLAIALAVGGVSVAAGYHGFRDYQR